MSTLVLNTTIAELPAGAIADPREQRIGLVRAPAKRVIDLESDDAFSVSLDGWTGINMLQIVATSKITAVITSAEGVAQRIPVDPQLNLVSRSVAITAIDLVRVPGQAATVELIIGQKA